MNKIISIIIYYLLLLYNLILYENYLIKTLF